MSITGSEPKLTGADTHLNEDSAAQNGAGWAPTFEKINLAAGVSPTPCSVKLIFQIRSQRTPYGALSLSEASPTGQS